MSIPALYRFLLFLKFLFLTHALLFPSKKNVSSLIGQKTTAATKTTEPMTCSRRQMAVSLLQVTHAHRAWMSAKTLVVQTTGW